MIFDSSCASQYEALIGCDEVGRGSLCGPVVVAAVWFEPADIPPRLLDELDDSKLLSKSTRSRLAGEILSVARIAIASSSSKEIDKFGIRAMTLSAMSKAIMRLNIQAPVRVDGLDVPPGIPLPTIAVVKGEQKIPQIAAASIVAKVKRDEMMARLSTRFPEYGWERNCGYGTKEHISAIYQYGPTIHHRMSFAPVSQLRLDLGAAN